MTMAKNDRSKRARMAAFAQHARHDTRDTTAAARRASLARFETQVDPEGVLPIAERLRRAEAAKKAFFISIGIKSGEARRAKRSAASGGLPVTQAGQASGVGRVQSSPEPSEAGEEAKATSDERTPSPPVSIVAPTTHHEKAEAAADRTAAAS